MSETSLHSDWNRSVTQRLMGRVVALVPYAALSVIAAIVFGTLPSHPF